MASRALSSDGKEAVATVAMNEIDTRRLLLPSITDWLEIAQELQQLVWGALADATTDVDANTVSKPQLVAHYLVTRLHDELRAVTSLVSSGFVIQALSLDAGMLEFAFTVGWVGKRQERAIDWLTWTNEKKTPIDKVRLAIAATYENGGSANVAALVDNEYWHYTTLCKIKHGNPKERRQFGIDLDDKGQPARFAGDLLSPQFIDASRLALWYAVRYMWLGVGCYNDFYGRPAFHVAHGEKLRLIRLRIERTRQADEDRTAQRALADAKSI